MKLGFEESQTSYISGSQNARKWTEAWVSAWAYCPHCGNAKMAQFPNNSPVADFLCASCKEEFELKSQKGTFGPKVSDGTYKTKCERLAASNNPNLLLMNYDRNSLAVVNLFIVPKHFFVPEIIEQRKPLAATARRAGWIGPISCSTRCRSPERFISCRMASFGRKNSFWKSGKRLCS
jgi:type II restriction enzyme